MPKPNLEINAQYQIEAIESALKRVGAMMDNANELAKISGPIITNVFRQLENTEIALEKVESDLEALMAHHRNP